MTRMLLGVALLSMVSAATGEQPKNKPGVPAERIDARTDRSLTGFVEKVDAKDERNGTVVIRTGKDTPRYTLHIDGETKVLRHTADPLESGLQSPLLKGAEVRITFVDRQPRGDKAEPAIHVCRTLQLIKPVKE